MKNEASKLAEVYRAVEKSKTIASARTELASIANGIAEYSSNEDYEASDDAQAIDEVIAKAAKEAAKELRKVADGELVASIAREICGDVIDNSDELTEVRS